VSVLELMTEQFPEDEEAYRDLAETYEMLDQWEEAREAWLRLEALTGKTSETRIKLADTWVSEGENETAETILREFIESSPESYDAIIYLNELLQRDERWEESLLLMHQLPEEYLNREHGILLALAYYQTGRKERSRDLLEQLKSNGLEDPQIYLLLAKIYRPDDYRQSLDMAEKAVRSGFLMLRRYNSIIEAELEQGSVFTEMSITRDEVDHYNQLSEEALDFMLQQFNQDDILKTLEGLLEEYSESPVFYYKMANFRYQHGETDIAMNLLTDALTVNSRYYEAHLLRGEIFESREELEQAELSYQRALSIQPDSRQPYRSLIRVHRNLGTLDTLADRWKIRYRAERENELLREFLIEVLQRADRFEEARQLIDQ
jgi:tetratricopeptide (TPR) repeat protein